MMETEVEIEPVPGLPEKLPAGERIVWQGRPRWQGLARHTFQVRWLGAYFAIFTLARGALALRDGHGVVGAAQAVAVVLPLAAVCLGLLTLLAWLNARATIYTITTRRVVIRLGVALPMTFNLPFKRLTSARLNTRQDGDGDIALELAGPDRIAWLHLWPHARPWKLARAQPMLRAIPEAARVSALLAEAVAAWSAAEGTAVEVCTTSATVEPPVPAAPSRLGPTLATGAGR